jgi:TorA maturation chaperone TorD
MIDTAFRSAAFQSAAFRSAAIRRAQIYGFLANAFLYPHENWLEEAPLLEPILDDLGFASMRSSILSLGSSNLQLPDLQSEHRATFGLTGSLFYETENGLPNEFRLSQELADIAGFYRAFGFNVGGSVRERPDHLAVELEFMYVLALKEWYASSQGTPEQIEVCVDAQRKFLSEHLGRWIGQFAESLACTTRQRVVVVNVLEDPPIQGIYPQLARFAADFVAADAERLGIQITPLSLEQVRPTPYDPQLSWDSCLASDLSR